MKICFIVTSAINCNYSVFDKNTRYEQTIKTIQSIRKKYPSTYIFLFEKNKLEYDFQNNLKKLVDKFEFLKHELEVTTNYNKSIGEAELMWNALSDPIISSFDYIFKISGRYCLNDDFDPWYITSENKNKIIGKRVCQPYMAPHESFYTTLYCVGKEMFGYACKSFKSVPEKFFENIEHTIFRDIDENNLINLELLGVEGYISPTGCFYKG
jgi:hypothetical protein